MRLVDFGGLHVQLVDPGSSHRGMAVFTGTLTAVPELAGSVSMLAGLASIAAMAFLRRRRPAN